MVIFLSVINLSAQPSPSDSTWLMFLHDNYHTGSSPLKGNLDTCYTLWVYNTGDEVNSSAALGDINGDGKVEILIGSNDGNLYALNGKDGSFIWSYTTGGIVYSSPTLGDIDSDGMIEVIFGSGDSTIYALNGEDGSLLWSYKTGDVVSASPTIGDIDGDDSLEVVIGSYDYKIYALKGVNGDTIWTYTTGGPIFSSAAIGDIDGDGNLEVIFGSKDDKVYALKGVNGDTIWTYTTGYDVNPSPSLGDIDGDGNLEVIFGSGDDNVYALNGEDGSYLWSYLTNGPIRSSTAIGDIDDDGNLEVVVGSEDYILYALNGEDGSLLWSYPTSTRFYSSAALGDIDGDGKIEVVVGSQDSKLYTLNGEDGLVLWSYITGGGILSSPALGDIDGDGKIEIVFGSADNKIYAINGNYGDIAISDSFYDFGSVNVGDYSDWIFNLFNVGLDTLIVDSIRYNPIIYHIVSPTFPQEIPPDDTIDVIVRFSPDTQKIYNDTLHILSDDPYDETIYAYLTGNGIDTIPPWIESTTVWKDTSYVGPFPIYTKVNDNLGVDIVYLYYKRGADPTWFYKEMIQSIADWYYEEIPQATSQNDTIKYYIFANDIAEPSNESTDPIGAPMNYYSFIANASGVNEEDETPEKFSFSVNTLVKDKAIFRITLPEKARISIGIYDVMGRIVAMPVSGEYPAGFYKFSFKPEMNGVYIYRVKSSYGERKGKVVIF